MDLTGKTVLVTGAAGTLGSALVRQILQSPVNSVRALDRDESGLFWMERACEGPKPRILLGDVRDRHRVEEACRGVDLVFHAAAHKHVPYCEYNAEEAASVNVMGTAVTVSAAAGAGVKQFVLLSTDKRRGAGQRARVHEAERREPRAVPPPVRHHVRPRGTARQRARVQRISSAGDDGRAE